MKQKLFFLAAVVCLCGGGGGYQAQAQLIVDVYPSQDTPTNTLWIFSGSSSVGVAGTLRTSGNHSSADGWQTASKIYQNNLPSNQTINLSSLFSSTNSKDIASVNARIPGGGKTNITFAANATNTPTITIAGRGTRTIARLFMDEASNLHRDGWGIRIQAPNLLYGNGEASSWEGAGVINKPIGDFYTGTFNNWGRVPRFAGSSDGSVRIVINSQIIPEPEEYALIFGLFALGFVFFHRWQKKKRQASAVIDS